LEWIPTGVYEDKARIEASASVRAFFIRRQPMSSTEAGMKDSFPVERITSKIYLLRG
jgi:hypothetical protein